MRVAYGFRKALAKIESGKVGGVRTAMLGLVCQRNYYYLLSGEKPIFPAMQKKIENIINYRQIVRKRQKIASDYKKYKNIYKNVLTIIWTWCIVRA